MGLGSIVRGAIAAAVLAFGSLGYTQNCVDQVVTRSGPLYVLSGNASERDPDLEHRLEGQAGRIPDKIEWYVDAKYPEGGLIISYDAPSRTPELAGIDPDRPTTSGTTVETAAAFVLPGSNLGYYNPERVASGTVSVNAYLHEVGHLIYHAIDMENQESLPSFRRASAKLRDRLAPYYPQGDRSDEEYERVLDSETFAEAFSMLYSHDHSRAELATHHEQLYGYMLGLESAVASAVEESLASGYVATCSDSSDDPVRAMPGE